MVILMALAGLAGAQDAAAGTTTWYVHDFADPSGSSAFLNFDPPEGESDQTATDLEAAGVDNFVIEIAAQEATSGPMTATAETGEAVVFVKSWNNGPAPRTRVRAFLHADGVEIANSGSGVIQDVLNGAIVEYRMPLTVVQDTIPAGAAVTMTVWIDDANTGVYNPIAYPRGVSEEHPWSITLPMTQEAGDEVVEETLAPGTDAEIALDFANATNATHRYSWDAAINGTVQVDYNITLTAGTVAVRVVDGANETLVNVTVDGSAEESASVDSATSGNWTVEVVAVGAVGTVALTVGAVDETPLSDAPPVEDGNETAEPVGNATAEDDGAFVPGPGAPLVAVSLLTATLLVRRRRP